MSWDAIDVVLTIVTIVIKIDKNKISINFSILLKYGFYVVTFKEILYNCNDNNSKTSELKNTSTHGSSSLLFNSKVLARSYVTPAINTIDKH